MSKRSKVAEEAVEISSEDLLLLSAIIIVIGDLIGLFGILKAREEKNFSNGSSNGGGAEGNGGGQ